MLTLPIKKKWFDMIRSGEKEEEYRGITDYYGTRFRNVFGYAAYWGEPHKIRLRNGYSSNSPAIIVTCTLSKKQGKPEVIYCEECDTVFTLDDCNATAEDIVNAWNRRAEDV